MKNSETLVILLPRSRRRAIELYSGNSPFKGKVEEKKNTYKRKEKHVKQSTWF